MCPFDLFHDCNENIQFDFFISETKKNRNRFKIEYATLVPDGLPRHTILLFI